MAFALEAEGLSKEYKKKRFTGNRFRDFFFPGTEKFLAVKDVSIGIQEGECFGLLGPNAAGKTTLIRLLTGLLEPSSGKTGVFGKSPEQGKQDLGLMMGNDLIYYRLSGKANLEYYASLYGSKNAEERAVSLLEEFGLKERMNDFVEDYSLGMKSRLALARALVNDPKIVFLDEPTLGLDPVASLQVRKYIKSLDKTVFLTTHYLEEAIELCDRIAVMDKGRIAKVFERPSKKEIEEEFLAMVKP